jgi:hypothetical protein
MEFSTISDELFIGTTPRQVDYDTLRRMGVRLVINMRFDRPPAPDSGQPPLDLLWLPTFDTPLLPIPIRALKRGAEAALATIKEGGRIYVHCLMGRHRGVAMGAAVLVAQGASPAQAMELIKSRRPLADPDAAYIRWRIHLFARRWAASVGLPSILKP